MVTKTYSTQEFTVEEVLKEARHAGLKVRAHFTLLGITYTIFSEGRNFVRMLDEGESAPILSYHAKNKVSAINGIYSAKSIFRGMTPEMKAKDLPHTENVRAVRRLGATVWTIVKELAALDNGDVKIVSKRGTVMVYKPNETIKFRV